MLNPTALLKKTDQTSTAGGISFDGAAASPKSSAANVPLLVAAAIGGAVAITLGVYGRTHTPSGEQIFDFGFHSLLAMKSWFTTAAVVLVFVQLVTALWMWGRLPGVGPTPTGLPAVHRWSGTTAFAFTLPVAYHCLWALGLQTTTTRVLVHSILGCAFYGAMASKLLLLRVKRLPSWAVPIAGGSLVALLTGLWFSSAYWYFTSYSGPVL